MTVTHFQTTNQALMLLAVESLATAPHFTEAQKKMRTEAVINAIMAFLPAEPVQTMLASQGVGHHFILLDTFREITNRALPDTMSLRLRSISGMQTKMTLALVKELRVVRKEMQAADAAERASLAAEAAQAEAPPQAEPEINDDAFAAHAAEYEEVLAALSTTLEEARTLDKPAAEKAVRHLEKAATPPAAPVWHNRAQRRAAARWCPTSPVQTSSPRPSGS